MSSAGIGESDLRFDCVAMTSRAVGESLMKLPIIFYILSTLTGTLLAAQTASAPTDLPGKPFFITKTWIVGGEGNWDALTVDPQARQLWIAHGRRVQIVDIESGAVISNIEGFTEARSIALDGIGEFAYVSDSGTGQVKVIDRATLRLKTAIPVATSPRKIYFDRFTDLLFVLPAAASTVKTDSNTQRASASRSPEANVSSVITVIDPQKEVVIGKFLLPGRVDSAQGDGNGQFYVTVTDRNQVFGIDEATVTRMLHDEDGDGNAVLDWSNMHGAPPPAGYSPTRFALAPACTEPKGLAVDGKRQRLFIACGNGALTVWNPTHGELVATLPINTATSEITYDSERSLLFAANRNGNLTVIRQYVTDSYTIAQILPTRQEARTLTLNPSTGEIYLVTNLLGFDLSKRGGIGKLRAVPVPGSFQVLVVGN